MRGDIAYFGRLGFVLPVNVPSTVPPLQRYLVSHMPDAHSRFDHAIDPQNAVEGARAPMGEITIDRSAMNSHRHDRHASRAHSRAPGGRVTNVGVPRQSG